MGTTDNEGRAAAFVRLGIRPGPGGIAVSVPSLGLRDTARYVVTTGGPHQIILSPTDTAITTGGSYTMHGETRDRFGNKRSDIFAWTVVDAGASVNPAGVVSSNAVGRYRVVAAAGGLSDTVLFSAVPPGSLLAFDWLQGEVVTLALDGTNRTVWARAIDTGIGVRPRLLPGGDRVVYSDYNGVIQELRVADATGASMPFLSPLPSTMGTHGDVAPDRQGSWVYFAAYDGRCPVEGYCLFRARIDGSSVEFLGDVANPTSASLRPTSSPDGRRVAYTTASGGDAVIRIMNADTRTLLPTVTYGVFPQWSPTGGRIAYIHGSGGVSLMNADGSGSHVLVPEAEQYLEGSFGWSPDEQWIVRATAQGFELIAVSTGKALLLPHLDALREPSWR